MFLTKLKTKYNIIASTKKISEGEARKRGYFGPVYHGTSPENRDKIQSEGFRVFVGIERSDDVRHGYPASSYALDRPAPVHHLGFGIYFTTAKAIAKKFNNDSLRGLKTYYLDIPRLETINFGSPNTMMKWWMENGYDIPIVYGKEAKTNQSVDKLRLRYTKKLTKELKQKYDAVWYKGKGLYKLLDGDQVCVFDPKRIYEIDSSLSTGWEIGSKVKRKSDNMIGVIRDIRDAEQMRQDCPGCRSWVNDKTSHVLEVKWKKGGTDFNIQDIDVNLI